MPSDTVADRPVPAKSLPNAADPPFEPTRETTLLQIFEITVNGGLRNTKLIGKINSG